MQVADALVGVDHGQLRALGELGVEGGLDLGTLGRGLQALVDAAQAVVRGEAGLGEGLAVLGEGLREEGADHVAEDDRVGDLHHRGLQVHGVQDALGLGAGDLGREELAQRGDAQHGGVDDLVLLHGHGLAQHRGGAVVADQLDPQRAVLGDHHGLLRGAEVVLAHGRHVGLGLGGPGAHAVRVVLGVVLHRGRGAAVGVALAQDRVDRGSLDLVVAGADVALLVGLRVVRVGRQRVALALQLGDGGLELRDGRRDVRQLDDVGGGRLGQLTELRQGVRDALVLGQVLREQGDDAAGQRDVAGLDRDTRLQAYARITGRNEYVARAGASSVCIDDGRVSHRVLRSTSATLLDIKISPDRPGLDRGRAEIPDNRPQDPCRTRERTRERAGG